MKTLRTELTTDGRLDILDRVMSYRGGMSLHGLSFEQNVIILCNIGYSQQVRSVITAGLRIIYRLLFSQDRRKIEKQAFSGNLLGIVATNALELGVDIGVLDAVIMLGFPIGGLASFVGNFMRG